MKMIQCICMQGLAVKVRESDATSKEQWVCLRGGVCVCVCVCVCVIISALLPFRGKMYIFLFVRGPRITAYCELQTPLFIQIQQEWKSRTWVHYISTLPNSLALLSVYIHPFIYNLVLWLDIYCKHCWNLEKWLSSLDRWCFEEKGPEELEIAPSPHWASVWTFSSIPFCFLLSHFYLLASPKFIFKDAFNITQLLPELIIIAHGFCNMTYIFF